MASDIYYSESIRRMICDKNLSHKKYYWAINVDMLCALAWGSVIGKAETRKSVKYISADGKTKTCEYRFVKDALMVSTKIENSLIVKYRDETNGILYGHIVEIMQFLNGHQVSKEIAELISEYKKIAMCQDMASCFSNKTILTEIYTQNPEYILAERMQDMNHKIDVLQDEINVLNEALTKAREEYAEKIIQISQDHDVTIGHYKRKLSQSVDECRHMRDLNDNLIRQQISQNRAEKFVVYKLPIKDVMALMNTPFRGGYPEKSEALMKFVEDLIPNDETTTEVYYITDGYDIRYTKMYCCTYVSIEGFLEAWSTEGTTYTILLGRKERCISMFRIGNSSCVSFDDPCRLLNGSSPEIVKELISKK